MNRIVFAISFSIFCSFKQYAQDSDSTKPSIKSPQSYYQLTDEEAEKIMSQRKEAVRYVDFHIHTTMKNYYNHVKSPKWLDRHIDENEIKLRNWDGKFSLDSTKFNNFKSYRQADWGIIAQSHASILTTAISPLEKHMISKKWPIKGVPLSFRWIYKRISGLPRSRLKRIYSSRNSSNEEFIGELQFLTKQQNTHASFPQARISLATDKKDLIEKFINGETALVLSLEGGHIFQGSWIARNKSFENPVFTSKEQAEILQNVDALKNLPNRVFFVTLGHFNWNGLVGSPKSLDMDNLNRKLLRLFSRRPAFREKLFLKYSDGIIGKIKVDTRVNPNSDVSFNDSLWCKCQNAPGAAKTGDIGWKVVNKLLDNSGRHQAPVYIDVKHMDIQARLDYYHFLRNNNLKIPIIASHVAMSGKDTILAKYTSLCPVFDVYEEVDDPGFFYELHSSLPDSGKRNACLDPAKIDIDLLNWFYPWGINLAKEEVSIIYESDGIIGLALEERVIGTKRPNYLAYNIKADAFLNAVGIKADKDHSDFKALLPFFKNLFYVAENSGRKDATAWDHISLGSDFDGIAKPLSVCKTAADIPKFHALLVRYLPLYVKWERLEPMLYGLSEKAIADKVVFENGERFILKYF